MKSLQDFIIGQYKESFPKDSLKVTSKKTNIQITRVFRIYNGSEMKLSEFEAFENAINFDIRERDFQKLAKQCSLMLSQRRLMSLNSQMNQALKLSTLQTTGAYNEL